MSEYVQCLVCGKMTPTRKGICYHCNSPLPSNIKLPPGMIVCPNCLRVTPADTGYCRRCLSPLPLDAVREAQSRRLELQVDQSIRGMVVKPGPFGRVIRMGGSQ